MHQRLAHPPVPEPPPSLLDNISDTLLNAFSKVRKPDERFLEIKEGLDKFEEALSGVDRIESRTRTRTNDLSDDYDNFSASIQGLAFLESGITEPLSKFEASLLDFSNTLKASTSMTIDPFLYHLSSLLAYSHAFRTVLKLRDQKQLDFEELSAYLSSVSIERDRLAAGLAGSPGLGSYFKAKVDALRGSDAEFGRESRIVKLDAKIKEVCTQPWLISGNLWVFFSAQRRGYDSARNVRGIQRRGVERARRLSDCQKGGNERAASEFRARAN